MNLHLRLKAFFVALVCCCAGAWAYSVPAGMGVKQVLFGTNMQGVSVAPETFEDNPTIPDWTNKNNFSIADVPTETWNSLSLKMSGKALRLGSRTTHELDFETNVTKGQVVFSTNFYVGTHQKQIKFIDNEGRVIAYFAFPDKSSNNGRVYSQQYFFAGSDYSDATFSTSPLMNDTYSGTRDREYSIDEFVIDLDNNCINYTVSLMDRRSSTNKWCTDTGKLSFTAANPLSSVKGIVVDATACGNNTYYAYFDNIALYSVGSVTTTDFIDPLYSANEVTWTTPNATNTKVAWEKYNGGTETINSHDQAGGGGFRFGSYYPGITTDGYSKVVISFNLALANPREQNVCNLYLMGKENSYSNDVKPSSDIILNFEWKGGTYTVNGISFANYIEKFTTTPSALVSGRSDGGMKLTPVTVTLDFATHKAKVEFAKKGGGVATIDNIDFVSQNVSQFVGFCDNIGRYDSAVGLSGLNVQGIKSVPESAVTSYSLYYQLVNGDEKITKKSEVDVRSYYSYIVKAENVITGNDGEQYQLADDSPTSFEVESVNAQDNKFYATVIPYQYSYTINYTSGGNVVFTESGKTAKGALIALRDKVIDGSQNYYKNSTPSVPMPGTDNYVFTMPVTMIQRAQYTLKKYLVSEAGESLLNEETKQWFIGEDVVLDYNGKTYFDGIAANKYRYVSDDSKGHPVTQDGRSVVSVYFKKIQTGSVPQTQLKRYVVAIPCETGGEMISWRSLDVDKDNPTTVFDVYRGSDLIAENLRTTTFVDKAGTSSSSYIVKTKVNGEVTEVSDAVTPWTNVYKTITLNRPAGVTTPDGVTCSYSPNDCSVADVDGDGDYEIVVKWDPSNSGDNMADGYRGNVYLDCYEFDGTQKWRIDLGVNIRAGAHYTQFLVYDFDGDGCAELVCKTAPGTKDGQGNYVSLMGHDQNFWNVDNYKDYRTKGGVILSGPEFLTVFDANSGSALHTIYYNPNRNGGYDSVSDIVNKALWGDDFGNRSERYLAAVAYLDGMSNNPSAVMCRGYYAGACVWAVDFDGSALTTKWLHSSTSKTEYILNNVTYNVSTRTGNKSDGSNTLYENGNHNLSIGDVDGDGKDEIIWGSGALDDDGKLMYATGFGHGDAIHLTDIDPDRPGLEVFDVHEEAPYGWDLHDARTGEVILSNTASSDNGRGMAADLYIDNRGLEFWSAREPNPQNAKGEKLSEVKPAVNFRTYWDGDLTEEFFDATNAQNPATPAIIKNTSVLVNFNSIVPSYTNNSTKSNPCLQADIFGDWREEIILRGESTATTYNLNIFSTTVTTPYLVTTPMQDHIYRMGIAWQNVAYNQPPHLGYYLPDVAAVKVTIGKNGYTTFCCTKNFTTKGIAGVTAYSASMREGSKTIVDLNPVVEVPAENGVIIKGVANATYYLPVIYDANEIVGNILTGVSERTTVDANSVYVLSNQNGEDGFYNYAGTSMPANKAFIRKSTLNDNGVKAFSISWNDDVTTSIYSVNDANVGNGNHAIYNLQGIPVAKPGKGIYIVNGRKVVFN